LNKKVLIISPYFPPTNGADMQRIRMSLPYFANYGWDATIVTVDEKYSDLPKDQLLLESIPGNTKVYKVKALNKKWTSKVGLGSIALRSLWYYRQTVNHILKNEQFDLIYFSTTQFPVCILGAYWKKRFGVPYIIDMQDPWYSTHYDTKPKEQRPAKYKIAYSFHKYMEAIAMKRVDGLISVSENYIADLKDRYSQIKHIPTATITFGAFEPDLKIAANNSDKFEPLLDPATKNIVYIGRGGIDLHKAIAPVFKALAQGINEEPELFNRLKLYFIGTSYAPQGKEILTVMPLAKHYGLENKVIEIPGRISYYHTLLTLQQANALFIPGSDEPAYTASKIYPYLLTGKPLLAIFNSQSSSIKILQEYGAPNTYSYDTTTDLNLKVYILLKQVAQNFIDVPEYNIEASKKYAAQNTAIQQCAFFNRVVDE
jgi:hypothetical protein